MSAVLTSSKNTFLPASVFRFKVMVYEKNSLKATKLITLDDANPYFAMIHQAWGEKLREAFNSIAEPSWSGANKSSDISTPAKKMGIVPINHPPSKAKATKTTKPTKAAPAKKAVKKAASKKVVAKKVVTKKK
jgi:putative proteasome-type protease